MPSSTSSSRAPKGPWLRIWFGAIAMAVVLLAAIEVRMRAAGFPPSINDTPDVWAGERARAEGDAVALIGASRMQFDVDPAVLAEELGRPAVQLSLTGSNGLPILADLAADEDFTGSVWWSLRAGDLFSNYGDGPAYLAHYRSVVQSPDRTVNRTIRTGLNARLTVRSPEARLVNWFQHFVNRTSPEVPYLTMRPDRFRPADYTMRDSIHTRLSVENTIIGLDRNFRGITLDRATLLDSLAVLQERVEAIERRGGEVVLIRFPVGPRTWDVEEAFVPRSEYWDVIAARTSAKSVHYKDYPELEAFPVPDESHLDFRDTEAFTRALARIVRAAPRGDGAR